MTEVDLHWCKIYLFIFTAGLIKPTKHNGHIIQSTDRNLGPKYVVWDAAVATMARQRSKFCYGTNIFDYTFFKFHKNKTYKVLPFCLT